MAGDWIKMRVDLRDDPAINVVRKMSAKCPDEIVGLLHRLWSWAGSHSTDGRISGVDFVFINEYLGCPNFSEALQKVGWLAFDEASETVIFPHWERHNSDSAKRRAVDTERKRLVRKISEMCPQNVPPKAGPEKRREEKSIKKKKEKVVGPEWTPSAGWTGIQVDDRESWRKAYPACDIDRQLAAMSEWLKANPEKAHKSAWRRFVTNWLARAQERGGDRQFAGPRQMQAKPPLVTDAEKAAINAVFAEDQK